jgi:hypothetical protein
MDYGIGFIVGLGVYYLFFCSKKNEEEIIRERFKRIIDYNIDVLKEEYNNAIEQDAYGKINNSNAEKQLDYFITKILGLDKDSDLGRASYNYIKKNI